MRTGLFGYSQASSWEDFYRPPPRLSQQGEAMDVRPIAWGLLSVFGGRHLRKPLRALNAAHPSPHDKAGWGKVVKEVLLSTFYHPDTDPLPQSYRGEQAGMVDQLRECIMAAPAYERLRLTGAYNMRRAVRSTEAVVKSLLHVLNQRPPPPEGSTRASGDGEQDEAGSPLLGLSPEEMEGLKEELEATITEAAKASEGDEQTLKMFSEDGPPGENCASQLTDEEVSKILDTMEGALPPHVLEMLGEFYASILGMERESLHEGLSVVGVEATDDVQRLLPDQLALMTHPTLAVRSLYLAEFCDGEMLGTQHEDSQPAIEGDFSLLLDGSGSMYGSDWDIAAALGGAAIAVAYQDDREVRGWVFASSARRCNFTGDLLHDAREIFEGFDGGNTNLRSALNKFLDAGGGDALIITDATSVSVPEKLWKRVTDSGRVVVIHVGGGAAEQHQVHWTTDHDLYYPLPEFRRGDPKLAEAVAAAFDLAHKEV